MRPQTPFAAALQQNPSRPVRTALPLLLLLPLLLGAPPAAAQEDRPHCEAERARPLVPPDPKLCTDLEDTIRDPSALPLGEYERKLSEFLQGWCHRNEKSGWRRDRRVRPTGPYTADLVDGRWVGTDRGIHPPVVIWYSKEMVEWMRAYRPADGEAVEDPPPVPDGAVMIKEMYPPPAAACEDVDPKYLFPEFGAAPMVRDREASRDGWYWGYYNWKSFEPDYPANNDDNRLPSQGFGQYCLNCHASARDDSTFADMRNVEGDPLVFLSQHFFDPEPAPSHHRQVTLPGDDADRLGEPHYTSSSVFAEAVPATSLPKRSWDDVPLMPSQTYDNTVVEAGGPSPASEFVTSSQCIGCHDAGSTGLQYDMTVPAPNDPSLLLNLSPYATWRSSPMGLGGRDPIFYAMLASEVDTFHPTKGPEIENICLGCHGITGQRQYAIDTYDPKTGECRDFRRKYVKAVPYPPDPRKNPHVHLADFGALARDGISCTACHHMLVGEGDGPALDAPENRCVEQRQELLNPEATGFARTFTGSFLVGPPDELYGPFESPKVKPMEHALGITPKEDLSIQASELCGTCHTVHLPVLADGETITYTYEQTTYPEWAFSDYRTGWAPPSYPGDELPYGAGPKAESCQQCHMASADADGEPFRSKIASIQELSSFPEVENALGREELDLEVRKGFARHTLVGLNVFFVKMAQQFPDVLGIRTQDPMLTTKGVDPLLLTERKMLDQASNDTADVEISTLEVVGSELRTTVEITSHTGHKLPSGVGFRRLFVEFAVVDELERVLWASGRTNGAGVIVDERGDPVDGELWWTDDCSARLHPDELVYQPHHQTITRQDKVQIYQELVTPPAHGVDSECGPHATPMPPLTTSFLSICGHVKDNRILPSGFLPKKQRMEIARALGAGDGEDLAKDSGPHAVHGDPDYDTGGGDSLDYRVDLASLPAGAGEPAAVRATLYYQAIPPFFLQDRFCTSKSPDTQRLAFLAGHLNLEGTEAADWKLEVVGTEDVPLE